MSYQEENGTVVLRMSRETFIDLTCELKMAASGAAQIRIMRLLDRLNQGNPNYTPYQVKP